VRGLAKLAQMSRGSYMDDSSEDEASDLVENVRISDSSSSENKVITNGVHGDQREADSDNSEDEAEEIEASSNIEVTSRHIDDQEEDKIAEETNGATDSSDTEEEREPENESEDEFEVEKIDVNDGCIPSKEVSNVQQYAEEDQDDKESIRSPSPIERTPSPEREMEKVSTIEMQRSRSPSPERKDSRGSEGSSSYDERASSLSPEPPKAILAPSSSSKVSSPISPTPSSHIKSGASPITKIYTEALVDSDGEEVHEKVMRHKPATDITQIYTAKLQEKEIESNSPKMERAFKGKAQGLDITQKYTAAFNKEASPSSNGKAVTPRRNSSGIAKLYTGGINKGHENGFKAKPADELTNPKKHNMSTSMDREGIKLAYNEVMADKNGVEWAAFIFDGPKLGVTAKGEDFDSFKSHFGPDDRGFGYIKIMTGDEMSRRSKFVFCTWVGPNVSVMKKAKMSTDKALMKEIIQNLSVELQLENASEISMDNFKSEVDKAGGARYGTGAQTN